MSGIPQAVLEKLGRLPKGLREHVRRVRDIAGGLAAANGVDSGAVDLAAAAHDLARSMKGEVILEEARLHGLPVLPMERRAPVLLHGAVAALWLEQSLGVSDSRVLEAVRWHTTGRIGMGPVARVVFLADKLDPEKSGRYPFLDDVRALSQQSLDRALLEFLNREMARRLEGGDRVHPGSLGLRSQLVESLA